MKLTSRSLKIGDRIIRKSPNKDGDKDFMALVVTIVSKSPTHVTVLVPLYSTEPKPLTDILDHFTWNDNEWVRYK